MFEKGKSALGVTASALTALSAAVGIFAWMNITPEMVGQAAYDTMRTWLPFVMFALGAIFGAGVTYVAAVRKAGRGENARVERNAAIIRNMDFKEKAGAVLPPRTRAQGCRRVGTRGDGTGLLQPKRHGVRRGRHDWPGQEEMDAVYCRDGGD